MDSVSGRKYRQDALYRKMKSHKKTAQYLRGFCTKLIGLFAELSALKCNLHIQVQIQVHEMPVRKIHHSLHFQKRCMRFQLDPGPYKLYQVRNKSWLSLSPHLTQIQALD